MDVGPSLKHRKDIDGLRALAVLPITLFHAGIPGFSGGYVGVDIFFVISGFLITSIIARDFSAGRFSLADFYERRVRRIFPALAGMLIFSAAAAYFILLPGELIAFAEGLVGTIFFVSNVVFFTQGDYFGIAAEDKPLLHTWSLGVEEQFYIFFPILFVSILRYAPRHSRLLLALCAGFSLALSIFLTPRLPTASFYLIPTRAWELFAGSLLAIGFIPKIPGASARTALSAAGVGLIVAAIMLFGSSTVFPGMAALLPVVGTALIIAYGDGTATGRLLSLRPFVFIGLISYSLYLWHWPLIVFGRHLEWLDGGLLRATAVVLLSISAGYLSYRFIETPFRNRAAFGRRRILALAATGSAVLLAAGTVYFWSDGLRARYSPEALVFEDAQDDFSPHRSACHRHSGTGDPGQACVFGGDAADTVLWGDSHGVELSYALGNRAHPLRSITYSQCPPALGFVSASRPDCDEHNRLVANHLRDSPEIRTVVIMAFFSFYMESEDFRRGLARTVEMLERAGKSVVVIGPVPGEGERNLPMRLARHGEFSLPVREYAARENEVFALLRGLQSKGATVIWPGRYLCGPENCPMTIDGQPLLFDAHHLSMTGARYLAARIRPLVWNDDEVDRTNAPVTHRIPPAPPQAALARRPGAPGR